MINKIGIIGGGNLGMAIAEGLIQSGYITPGHILITRRSLESTACPGKKRCNGQFQ